MTSKSKKNNGFLKLLVALAIELYRDDDGAADEHALERQASASIGSVRFAPWSSPSAAAAAGGGGGSRTSVPWTTAGKLRQLFFDADPFGATFDMRELGGSGGPTDGGAAARHSTPHYECTKTCLGRSCDDWTAGNDSSVARETCAKLERQFRCDCGGCACAASAPRQGRRRTTSGECIDTDDGATDPYGDDCEDYAGNEGWCGLYDGATFSSIVMCCACGGGSVSASPTLAPSFTASPSTSSAPTGGPEQAAVCGRMRALINALAPGESLVVQVMNDMSCPQQLSFWGDLSVRAFGDATASRPALSGGGATRIFMVEHGALLEIKMALIHLSTVQ